MRIKILLIIIFVAGMLIIKFTPPAGEAYGWVDRYPCTSGMVGTAVCVDGFYSIATDGYRTNRTYLFLDLTGRILIMVSAVFYIYLGVRFLRKRTHKGAPNKYQRSSK